MAQTETADGGRGRAMRSKLTGGTFPGMPPTVIPPSFNPKPKPSKPRPKRKAKAEYAHLLSEYTE